LTGISTAQAQLVAEELSVRSAASTLFTANIEDAGSGVTSGSQSHPTNFNRSNLAQAELRLARRLSTSHRNNSAFLSISSRQNGVISAKSDPSKKVATPVGRREKFD